MQGIIFCSEYFACVVIMVQQGISFRRNIGDVCCGMNDISQPIDNLGRGAELHGDRKKGVLPCEEHSLKFFLGMVIT